MVNIINNNYTISDIKEKIGIVDLIGETIKLEKKGPKYWGLCCFHEEKTSSFMVDPDRQRFYCFACQSGGDVFDFVMKREGLQFREALVTLAERAGINIELDPATKKKVREVAHQHQIETEEEEHLEALLREKRHNLASLCRLYGKALLLLEPGRDFDEYPPLVISAIKRLPTIEVVHDILISGSPDDQLDILLLTGRVMYPWAD